MRLLNLRLNLLKIAKDIQDLQAHGRIETADLTWMEQTVSTLDEVVTGALPKTRIVRRKKFLGVEISWWGRKDPKSPK